MKFFVLICIFLNVLVIPWGLAHGRISARCCSPIPLVLLKVFGFILVLVYIESSLAKLRLFRITEFLGAAFVISRGRDDHSARRDLTARPMDSRRFSDLSPSMR